MKKKQAFTLAEVLITLAIIGVVAAITIPSLVKNYQKQQWISGYKSTFTLINQATKMIMANNDNSLMNTWADSDDLGMYNAYLPYLKVIKKCENVNPQGCSFATSYVRLNGYTAQAVYSAPYDHSLVLSNGASIYFRPLNGTEELDDTNRIFIDVNGAKGPNIYGRDLHEMWINTNSNPVQPYGFGIGDVTTLETHCPSTLVGSTGVTCGMRILRGDYGTAY